MRIVFWLMLISIFSIAMAPMVLMFKYNRRDVAALFKSGLKSEGRIINYESRRCGEHNVMFIIFEFTPEGRTSPMRFSKAGYADFKNHPPGSSITIYYNKKFPIMSVIDFYGNGQGLSSSLES